MSTANSSTSKPAWSYDAIADVYATDMGQSMPFDDVGWYRALAVNECRDGGRLLELGCGTGRILIELVRAGIDAVGADRSLPMLARLRADAHNDVAPRILQMDIAAPALCGRFRVILLPYSLITYLCQVTQAAAALQGLGALLEAGGCLVLDAFVPREVATFTEFRRDYRRAYADGWLERHKRISVNADGSNRIERVYQVLATDGRSIDEFSTDETIRPYHACDLIELGTGAGLDFESGIWDYAAPPSPTGPRFATVVLRKHS
jgi:SAM-dependent methyltransferase